MLDVLVLEFLGLWRCAGWCGISDMTRGVWSCGLHGLNKTRSGLRVQGEMMWGKDG